MILHYTLSKNDYESAMAAHLKTHSKAMNALSALLIVLACLSAPFFLIILFLIIRSIGSPDPAPPATFALLVWPLILFIPAFLTHSSLHAKWLIRGNIKSGAILPEYFGPQRLE